ncbi:FtsK/SpoIIIE domain-containing protein [Isoptericola halotolerans]|uniref:FtsK/SpoIIIE domain-containing protein n=1 Tax=Isoptericola halotolerans TaxID=300560 RepID=UPI0038908808
MPVRLTLHPGEDVDLPEGVRLGDLRAPLAELVRRPELWHARLEADGTPVGDDAVVGHRPLLPGATLRAARTGRRGTEAQDLAALRSPWLVTPTTGPGAGETLPLAPDRPVILPGAHDRTTVLLDARCRVRVRAHRHGRRGHRWPGAAGAAGAGARAALLRADGGRERRRTVGLLRRRWRPGTLLEAGGRRYALHRSGDVATWLAPPAADPAPSPPVNPAMLLTGLVPVLGSVTLAVMLRQPLYALFSLVAVVALVPQVVSAVRRRRAAREDPSGTVPQTPPAGTAPGRTAARVAAAHQASKVAWRHALDSLAARSRSAAHRDGVPTARTPRDLLPDGALAVRGPAGAARAAARAVVVDLAAAGADVQVTGAGHGAWGWARWLAPGTGAGAREVPDRVLVVDDPDRDAHAAAEDAVRHGHAVVLCLPHEPGGPEVAAPSWCRATLRVAPGGVVHRTAPDGTDSTAPSLGVSTAWAERTARRLAGLRALRRALPDLDAAARSGPVAPAAEPDEADATAAGLPGVVPLGDLLDDSDPTRRWAQASGWRVPLGVDAAGSTVELDLVADGPHLLVAGTTGAGKSELLQSLVLGLALTRSPADLALALVDFKGGASFGPCADLPHVVGQVTDLEPGLAGRALAGLRAELHRRERVLAEHRVASLDDAPPGTLPRLVVVIDEFRALADDLPDFLPGLLRVAAQGRSLGVHLVLATQRPSGAVSTDVRANVSARIALRVVDAADSHDVVGTAAASRIPVGTPGRAVLRVGSAPPVALQCAHAGTVPDGGGPVVRRAPTWRRATAGPPLESGPLPVAAAPTSGAGPVGVTVASVRDAAARRGHRPGPAPWLPPLPTRVTEAELARDLPASDEQPGGLPLALADDPDRQRRVLVRWHPRTGHLAVVGATRSGRTTALVSLAASALARGLNVHVLAPPAATAAFADLAGHPGLGTVTGPDDPRRARRVLRLVDGPPGAVARGPSTLVVVDRVEELRAALAGRDTWDPLVSALTAGGAAFALSTDSATVGGLAARVGPRLVLLGTDQHEDVMRGVPAGLAGGGGPPGRGAWLTSGAPLGCQVLSPSRPTAEATRHDVGPARVEPLPTHLTWDDIAAVQAGSHAAQGRCPVVVGVGDDGAVPVTLDVAAGALVTGPRGGGRSTVLRTVVRSLSAQGRLAAVVSRDALLRSEPGSHTVTAATPAAVRRLVEDLAGAGPGAPTTVVVDDLDTLAQACPVEVERLGALAEDGRSVLVASATTQGALMAHRGPLAELRARRHGIVLAPGGRDADEVLGTALTEVADPGPPRPGRGALVRDGVAVALQAAGPSAGGVRDHLARHEPAEGPGGEQDQHHPGHDGDGGAAGEQRDTDDPLEDLPAGDGRSAAPATAPQGEPAAHEEPRQPEEERDDEDADADTRGATAHELDEDGTGEHDHGGGLETDDRQHTEQHPGCGTT